MATKKGKKTTAKPVPEAPRDSLLDQMDGDNAEAFRFENAGDMIVGKVVRFGRAYSKYGPHPVVVIADETTGEHRAVHCMQTVLRNQMVEADPSPGDRIAVKYSGERDTKLGDNTYHDFRVRVDSPAARSFSEALGELAEPSVSSEDDDDDDGLPF